MFPPSKTGQEERHFYFNGEIIITNMLKCYGSCLLISKDMEAYAISWPQTAPSCETRRRVTAGTPGSSRLCAISTPVLGETLPLCSSTSEAGFLRPFGTGWLGQSRQAALIGACSPWHRVSQGVKASVPCASPQEPASGRHQQWEAPPVGGTAKGGRRPVCGGHWWQKRINRQ